MKPKSAPDTAGSRPASCQASRWAEDAGDMCEAHTPRPGIITEKLPICESYSGCFTFTRHKKTRRWQPSQPLRLENSLLVAVGLLELANAGDFAANVWNQIPVPIYAIVFMAIGGTCAIGISHFAVRDVILSWRNYKSLRSERRYLKAEKERRASDRQVVYAIDTLLDVNYRELGTELVDRVIMDSLMGFGALMVGIGTYMAIWGANPTIFYASNLLSGYVGNFPLAAYSVFNLGWSAYVWRRAQRHKLAARQFLKPPRIKHMLAMRISSVKLHAALNGITGAVAGSASLVTATKWWGYVVLAPCIIISVLINLVWRRRVGYERPYVRHVASFDQETLVCKLEYVYSCRQLLAEDRTSEVLEDLVINPSSLPHILDFLSNNNLVEPFLLKVLEDSQLSDALFNMGDRDNLTIDLYNIRAVDDEELKKRLIDIAQALILKSAPVALKYQEYYLLEALGCYMSSLGQMITLPRPGRPRGHANLHTECGRHGDAWLFGNIELQPMDDERPRTGSS